MKTLKEFQKDLNEAPSQYDDSAQRITSAVSTLKMRKQGINPAQVISAVKALKSLQNKNLTASQQIQRLPANRRNQYLQFGNEIPTGLLDPSIKMGNFRQVVQRLKTTKQQIDKAQQDSQKMADAEQQKAAKQQQKTASKQQVKESDELIESPENISAFSPPAMVVLKRIGTRNFPDGRHVALYTSNTLGLIFSIPYTGKGQTPGEIVPGVEVTHATNEEIENIEEGLKHKLAAAGLAATMAMSPAAHAYNNVPSAPNSRTVTTTSVVNKASSGNVLTRVSKTANDVARTASSVGSAARSVGNAANSIDRATKDVGKLFKEDQEEELYESFDQIKDIAKSDGSKHLTFKDGNKVKIHPQVAGVIADLHKKLNSSNQAKVEKMLQSAGGYNKIADFALSKSKWQINK